MSSTMEMPARRRPILATVRTLVGSGDRIAKFTLPFVIAGAAVQVAAPRTLTIPRPARPMRVVSLVALAFGVATWAWSVALILTRVPKGQLIVDGPYAVVKHPLYASVSLLVLPAAGALLRTWLGAVIGLGLYLGARRYAPEEEADLARRFGQAWESYRRRVLLPWL